MKFIGTDQEFSKLKDGQENLIEALLANVYNEGYNACNNTITNLFEQAKKAIEQHIDPKMLRNQNPFLDVVAMYSDSLHDDSKIDEPGLEGI